MSLVPLHTLLAHAKKHRYAIPAFNVSFQEQLEAIFDAATQTNSPIIIQLSSGGLKHAASWLVPAIIRHAQSSSLPVCLHRDHCHTLDEFEQALSLGFSSIMIDGSLTADGTPTTFAQNVSITQKAIALAAPHNVSVEAELGCLGSLETGESGEEDGTAANTSLTHKQMLTDPQQAELFIEKTGAHALAIAIGTSHGAYKFSQKPTDKTLDIDRVALIAKHIPNTPLVLHGSSSIPGSLCDTINQHGGHIPTTYGVPIPAIQAAITQGVCKVNIDSDLRLACTAAVRKSLTDKPGNFDPRSYLHAAYLAMKDICTERYQAFGCVGMATSFNESQHETHTANV